MRYTLARICGLAALLLLGASTLAAQSGERAGGFWLVAGLGGGHASITCDGCTRPNPGTGPMAVIELDRALSPRFVLAAEVQGYRKSANAITDRFGFGGPVLRYYPFRSSLFLGAGAGIGRYHAGVHNANGDSYSVQTTAPAVRLEAGYELRLKDNFSLLPSAGWQHGFAGGLKSNGDALGINASFSTFQFSVGLAWRWSDPPVGLP